jgi:hypothetical protein
LIYYWMGKRPARAEPAAPHMPSINAKSLGVPGLGHFLKRSLSGWKWEAGYAGICHHL